jgi:mRNA interferase MazF
LQRGDVVWALFAPRSGSEQHGLRPAVLVSHQRFNSSTHWKSLIVVPVSSQPRISPTVVVLPKNTVGLQEESYVLCHQVTVLDRSKLRNIVGHLEPEVLNEVEKGMLEALGIIK